MVQAMQYQVMWCALKSCALSVMSVLQLHLLFA